MNKFVTFLFLLCLAGCATTSRHPLTPALPTGDLGHRWEEHQKQVAKLTNWKAQGRLAVTQGNKGGNASFVWEQQGDFYQIKLWGPFGAGAVYLMGGPARVQARKTDGKTVYAKNPEDLIHKLTGWKVPVTGLRYWLVGLPASQSSPKGHTWDNEGLLLSLQQDGWQIDYEAYGIYRMASLPNKLHLKRGDIKVKFLVNSWEKL